ncbi:hypothetical protein PSE_1358 [Pseudovibrio sp. FO-BEG1]|nr:hypothetical protein PSE_1358 [Pseudovibrio sp. FO-BEG1]
MTGTHSENLTELLLLLRHTRSQPINAVGTQIFQTNAHSNAKLH